MYIGAGGIRLIKQLVSSEAELDLSLPSRSLLTSWYLVLLSFEDAMPV